MATTETVKKCYKPLKKVCNGQGPEECRTVYESSCTTRYIEKQEGKFVGDTNCERLPIEICGAGCTIEQQPEECHDKEVNFKENNHIILCIPKILAKLLEEET